MGRSFVIAFSSRKNNPWPKSRSFKHHAALPDTVVNFSFGFWITRFAVKRRIFSRRLSINLLNIKPQIKVSTRDWHNTFLGYSSWQSTKCLKNKFHMTNLFLQKFYTLFVGSPMFKEQNIQVRYRLALVIQMQVVSRCWSNDCKLWKHNKSKCDCGCLLCWNVFRFQVIIFFCLSIDLANTTLSSFRSFWIFLGLEQD